MLGWYYQNKKILVSKVYIWFSLHRIKTVTSYSFGLGESSLDHRRREEFPAISNIKGNNNEGGNLSMTKNNVTTVKHKNVSLDDIYQESRYADHRDG